MFRILTSVYEASTINSVLYCREKEKEYRGKGSFGKPINLISLLLDKTSLTYDIYNLDQLSLWQSQNLEFTTSFDVIKKYSFQSMVLILDGNSGHVAYAWRQMSLF